MLQEVFIFHAIASQVLLSFLFFVFGYKNLFKNIRSQNIPIKSISLITVLICCSVIFESYGIKELPIAITVLSTVIPILIYSIYDLKKSEIKLSKQSIVALFLIITGIIILSL